MILVNNLSRFSVSTEKVKLKISKILKLLEVFDFKDKQKIDPRRKGLVSSDSRHRQTGHGVDRWYLEVNFLTSRKMSELHEKFLKKSGPTTVISVEVGENFPVGEFSDAGEIYLCPQEIKKSGFGWEYFLVHGILHLHGYDHKTGKEGAAMLEKEKQICGKMGIGSW